MAKMANERNNSNHKLVLMNDEIFSRVYTAGTDVKKFTQQSGKHNQVLNIMEMSKFVLSIVESRNLALEVNAKIVCGMGRILLQNLQNIFDEMLSIQKRSKINRRIEYGVKNIVKKVKVQVERNNGTAVPLDIDLAVVNFDVDFQEQITEKEVIYSLSCNNGTTVKNVEDITMRDAPHPEDYSSQVQLTEDNDFGETMPTEMLDFLYSDDEPEVHPAIEKNAEPATLDDMDIDLSVEADVDMGTNSNHIEHDLQPLEEALPPVPMDTATCENDVPTLQPIGSQKCVEASIHEGNDEGTSNSPPTEDVIQTEETQMVPSTAVRKRRLTIDACIKISARSYEKLICNWSMVYCKNPEPSLDEIIAEYKLQSLFTKPLRDCCNRMQFDRDPPLSRKRNRCYDIEVDFSKKKRHTKRVTASEEPPIQAADERDAEDLQLNQPSDDPHFTSVVPVKESEMANFLTCFTGNPSQWDFLKNSEPSTSEGDKQKKNDTGAVTRYAIKTLLGSMFQDTTDNCVPFKLLQSKMSNRLIAVSLFAKLLELSKEKIIRVSTAENGSPLSVHKYINWDK